MDLRDEAPWPTNRMRGLYIATFDDMFHEPPAEDPEGLRPRDYFSCSSLGRCMRFQILQRAGFPKHELDDGARSRMDIGSQLHYLYSQRVAHFGLRLAREVAITDTDLELSGHIDLIWGGPIQEVPEEWRIVRKPDWIFFLQELRRRAAERFGDPAPVTVDELKTVAGGSFKHMPADGYPHYRNQLAGYRLLALAHPDALGLPQPKIVDRWQLVVFNREGGGSREIPMRQAWVDEAQERLGTLREAWRTGSWPNCTCGATEGIRWEAKLCDYPGPSGCCQQSLLERLEASLAMNGGPS